MCLCKAIQHDGVNTHNKFWNLDSAKQSMFAKFIEKPQKQILLPTIIFSLT